MKRIETTLVRHSCRPAAKSNSGPADRWISCSRNGLLVMTLVVAIGLGGCDQAKELADNAVNKVKKDFQSAKDKINKAAQGDEGKKTGTPARSMEPPVNPVENTGAASGGITYEAFRRIATNQLQDSNLEALARDPKVAESVVELDLYSAKITAKGLETLASFPRLEKLNLQEVRATVGNMQQVGKLKSLKSLNLMGNPLTDEDFLGIVGLSNLEEINVTGTQITDEGFRCFKQMPNLAVMTMDRMGHLEGKGFKYVNSNSIRVIKANGSKIGYFAFKSIGGSESLEELWLNGARVTDEAMQGIGRCPNLKEIYLERNDLTDKGISYLKNHQGLETVVLAGNPRVSNLALGHLTKSKSLKLVNVSRTSCSAEVKDEFLKYVPGCNLVF